MQTQKEVQGNDLFLEETTIAVRTLIHIGTKVPCINSQCEH